MSKGGYEDKEDIKESKEKKIGESRGLMKEKYIAKKERKDWKNTQGEKQRKVY